MTTPIVPTNGPELYRVRGEVAERPAIVSGEIESLTKQFHAETRAAAENLALLRTAEGESTHSGRNSFIAACSIGAKTTLAGLFATPASKDRGQSIV